jgi:hypothetical protein
VTPVPKLKFWRSVYPELDEREFSTIFNRYAHIIPDHIVTPRIGTNDSVIVPVSRHSPVLRAKFVRELMPHVRDGHVDLAKSEGSVLILIGWAPWTSNSVENRLELIMDPQPSSQPVYHKLVRKDLPPATRNRIPASSGFDLRVPIGVHSTLPRVCVFAYDAATSSRALLINPPNLKYCQGIENR